MCLALRTVRFEQEIPFVVSKQANLISTKLQDNLRHVTSTDKSRIRCTPRLKYRLDTSIRNYIVTTIWRVHDISKSMPHLDSYATPLLHFTLRALRVVLFGRTSYTLVVYMRTEQVIRSYRADHACILIHALAHLVMARKTPSLSYEVYRSTGRLDYSWIQAENSEWKLCWMASFKQSTL